MDIIDISLYAALAASVMLVLYAVLSRDTPPKPKSFGTSSRSKLAVVVHSVHPVQQSVRSSIDRKLSELVEDRIGVRSFQITYESMAEGEPIVQITLPSKDKIVRQEATAIFAFDEAIKQVRQQLRQ